MIQKGITSLIKIFLLFQAAFLFESVHGQQVPFNPVSNKIFNPFIINPAAAGNKDFMSFDLLAGFNGQSHSQMISGNTRLLRKASGYGTTRKIYSFSNIGAGGFAYNDYNNADSTHNAGLSATVSYHIPLNSEALSFFSIGTSIKGMYHFSEGDSIMNIPYKEFYFPNADIGVYFYNPNSYAGISVTNILDPPDDTDTLMVYNVPVSRRFNLIAGYKFILSRSLNIVLEPSLIIHTDDSLSFDFKENIEPALRLYAGNFCIGTYFNDYSNISFFFQYRYPKFYVGTFFALPKDSPFYKKSLTAEIAMGINFAHNKSGFSQHGHW